MRFLTGCLLAGALAAGGELENLRDRQDRPALETKLAELMSAADKRPNDVEAQYRASLAASYLAEAALELRDRNQARTAAETGIRAAQRAVALKPAVAAYHRLLGTLCGQVIPANVLTGLKYGKCAQESVNKALELDPRSAEAYLSRGVGNYYLPSGFGGGIEIALRDFSKAVELDPRSAEAHLWLGLALRRANRNAEARQALARSLELNPNRIWTRQQLDKTPK